jgi:hypothetical protein
VKYHGIVGGMAPTLKQTIKDRISKGNIHVENDEASTSEQAAGMGKKAGKKRPCHNRRKGRGGRGGQAPLGPATTNQSTSLPNPLPQRGQFV